MNVQNISLIYRDRPWVCKCNLQDYNMHSLLWIFCILIKILKLFNRRTDQFFNWSLLHFLASFDSYNIRSSIAYHLNCVVQLVIWISGKMNIKHGLWLIITVVKQLLEVFGKRKMIAEYDSYMPWMVDSYVFTENILTAFSCSQNLSMAVEAEILWFSPCQ